MSEATQEGINAYNDGEDPEDCPYEQDAPEHVEWLEGWKFALLGDKEITEDVRVELLKKVDAER